MIRTFRARGAARAVQASDAVAARFRAGPIPGCSIIRASLTVALMVSLPRFGSLWAFGPSAHWAHASLRTLSALAVAQTHIPKYRIWKYTRALSWSGLVSASKPITL